VNAGKHAVSIKIKGCQWPVPKAFRGELVAIRPRGPDGHYAVCFGANPIASIDLTNPQPVSHLSEQVSTMAEQSHPGSDARSRGGRRL
jgi:hypothetical protein